MYRDSTPIFSPSDRYVLRFRVTPLVLLAPELAIPVGELWTELSRTRRVDRSQPGWAAHAGLMSSLAALDADDGALLHAHFNAQLKDHQVYELSKLQAQALVRETR